MGGKKTVEKSRFWEKERRNKLNDKFGELCRLLPDHDPTVTLSKVEILKKAAEYIKFLQDKNDEIIQCGNSTSLKNQAERLKKRVAFLLLKTKELVNALRVAGVPIPANKKKKNSPAKIATTPTKNVSEANKEDNIQNKSKLPDSANGKKVKCGCDKKKSPVKKKPLSEVNSLPVTSPTTSVSSSKPTAPIISNTMQLLSTTQGTIHPIVSAGIQSIGIDKKVLSQLGPGTLILADGRVVNVPPVVPQIVVKTQPTAVLVMQGNQMTNIRKKEKLIVPKKKDITQTTFANKAPIPAIKTFRLESQPRTQKSRAKKIKANPKTTKAQDVVVTSISTSNSVVTITTTSSITFTPSEPTSNLQKQPIQDQQEKEIVTTKQSVENDKTEETFPPLDKTIETTSEQEQHNNQLNESEKDDRSQSIVKYTIDALFSTKQPEKNQIATSIADTPCSGPTTMTSTGNEIQDQQTLKLMTSSVQDNVDQTSTDSHVQSLNFQVTGIPCSINNSIKVYNNKSSVNSSEIQSQNIETNINLANQVPPSSLAQASSIQCNEMFFSSSIDIHQPIVTSSHSNTNERNMMESCQQYTNKEVQQNICEIKGNKNSSSNKKSLENNKKFYDSANVMNLNEPQTNQISSLFGTNDNVPKSLIFTNNENNNMINSYGFPNLTLPSSTNDLFSHDIPASSQKEIATNHFEHSNAQLTLHNTNTSSIKNQIQFSQSANVFSHSSMSISQFASCNNQNLINSNVFPHNVPTANKKMLLQLPQTFSQTTTTDHINNSTQTAHSNQIFSHEPITSCQSSTNHLQVSTASSQSNCDNFSMSNITTKSNNSNLLSEKHYNQNHILNETNSAIAENNQSLSRKTAPVCVLTNNKTNNCQDKVDKLYSTNTEGNSFKTDAVCSNDFLHAAKEIERNPFIPPIEDVRLTSDFSNDLFSSLQVPTGGQHSESISPTAAFLLAFPLVSTSKNADNMNETESHENQTSTPTTILQIGNIEAPNSEMFQPVEFGKGKEFDITGDYMNDVHLKCKRKEINDKKNKTPLSYQTYNNYPNTSNGYNNQYDSLWPDNSINKNKQFERKKTEKIQKTYNYEYYKQERKKKSKISVNWMTTPEVDMYQRESETSFLSSGTQYNVEIDNIPDLYTSKKTSYSWSPNKSLLPLDNNLIVPTSTLPTLVGDLALGTSTPSEIYKRQDKKTVEKNEDKLLQPKTQANFLSVSQLVDPKSKKLKPPERQFKKHEKKRTVSSFPKRKDTQDPCMFTDNFIPNFNWDKQRYKGNYSAESLIGTQEINESYNYQQNNYFPNTTDFAHESTAQTAQYQNCFNFPQSHFSSFVPEEYQADTFGINNANSRSLQNPDKVRETRCREEGFQTGFLQGHYHAHPCTTTASSIPAQTNFNVPGSTLTNYNSITTNATTSLTNFNLSTIFPEMNDQRAAPSGQGNHMHMNTYGTNQSYRSHPTI